VPQTLDDGTKVQQLEPTEMVLNFGKGEALYEWGEPYKLREIQQDVEHRMTHYLTNPTSSPTVKST
jgi:hypothetical protein